MNLNLTKKTLAIIILLITCITSFAQNRNINSLKNIIAKTKEDTIKIQTYIDLSYEYKNINLDTALFYSDLALNKSFNINYKKGIADSYKQKGAITIYLNNYKLADSLFNIAILGYREINYQFGIMECYIGLAGIAFNKGENRLLLNYSYKALKITEDENLNEYKAMILNNIGGAYVNMGDYKKATENILLALRIFEQLENKPQVSSCNINLGCLFIEIEEFDNGLKYMNKAFNLCKELEDTKKQSICLTNIGGVFKLQKKYNEALKNYDKSLELNIKNYDLSGISTDYSNIGSIKRELKLYKTASEYYNKSLEIRKQIGDKRGIASCYVNIAILETEMKKYDLAEEYCLKSIELFEQINELDDQRAATDVLSNIYYITGKYKKSHDTHIKADIIKDSLFNVEKAEKIAQLDEKYLNEKLEKQNLVLKLENDLQQTEIFQQKKLQNIYFIAFVFAITAIILIIIQYRKKNIAYKFLVLKNMDLLNKEKELKDIKEQKNANKPNNNKTKVADNLKEDILYKLKQQFDNKKIFKIPDLTINKLAKEISTNRTYLSQTINDEFGKSFIDLINEYRIKEAIILFSNTKTNKELSIAGIAKEVGFNSVSSFIIAFKKYTGVTPSTFRQEAIGLVINKK